MSAAEFMGRPRTLPEKLATCHPSLSRNRVWCHYCGHTRAFDSAVGFRIGWPKCCGSTMSIDSPEEHAAMETDRGR